VLPPLEEGQTVRPHLDLWSANGKVSADVELVRGNGEAGRDGERVILKAESRNGSVTVKINNPQNQHLDLYAKSLNGSVHIYIPNPFHGPITASTKNGSVTFSEQIQKDLITFSERDGAKTCFLGEFEGSGFGKEGMEWEGDVCVAETRNGSVKIWYIDEDKTITGSGGQGGGQGFWGRLFGGRSANVDVKISS